MKITVLFFGILKDIVEKNSLSIEIESNCTIDNFKKQLMNEYQKLTKFTNFSVAVNEEYVDENYVLKSNDVVALIPPVSGG